ncbi:MAG: carbohydrate ABC transporter permease [Ruminococcaceae bacterium]|nr:carbohydrate ABC transporter permease [Oscillospiraceae bacterium]
MKVNKNNLIKRSTGEKIFSVFNYIFMVGIMFIMLYPLWYVLVASFSDPVALSGHSGFLFKPLGFSTDAYRLMTKNPMIFKGYGNTLFLVIVGLAVNMTLTCLGAYFMSRKNVPFQKPITLMIIFTMYFSGGMIPFYMTVMDLGLKNSLMSLILPGAVSTFNLIILRTAFASVPEALEESARLDGASHWRIMLQIVLPLSKASLSVIALYYAVGHWNAWFNAMLFLDDRELFPLQLVLREILIQNDTSSMTQMVNVGDSSFIGETIKYAVIIVSVVPILCIYPFIQKYFEKGVMIGAVKG